MRGGSGIKALIIIASVILFFVLLLSARVGVRIRYGEEGGFTLHLTVLGIGVKTLIPEKKKKKKLRLSDYTPRAIAEREAKARAAEQTKHAETRAKSAKKKKSGGGHKDGTAEERKKTFSDKLALVRGVTRMASALIARFFGYLHTDVRRLCISVGTGDAAKTALSYAAITNACDALLALLDENSTLHFHRGSETGVYADWLAESSTAEIDIALSLSLRQALSVALHGLVSFFEIKAGDVGD